jgi:hypothetical protein
MTSSRIPEGFGRYLTVSILAAVATMWHAFSTRRQCVPRLASLDPHKLFAPPPLRLRLNIHRNGVCLSQWNVCDGLVPSVTCALPWEKLRAHGAV